MSHIAIHPLGAFGRAVAGYLCTLRSDVCVIASEIDVDARVAIVASWRPCPDVCARWDDWSHRQQTPFVALVADGASLTLGPVVMPGRGPCWACFARRTRQHALWPDRRAALDQHYADQPDAGPAGYLEPAALLGAARLSEVVEAIDAGTVVPGSVWQINLLSREVASSVVVGVHDCPRCGLHRFAATRSVAELREALAYRWK